jgi:hypothetical protein
MYFLAGMSIPLSHLSPTGNESAFATPAHESN